MMMAVMMVVAMPVIVTTAAFFSIMIVMMLMVVVMFMTAAALFPIMMVLMMMVMIMMAATAGSFLMIVVVIMPVIVTMLMIMLLFPVSQHLLHQLLLQIGTVLNGLQDFLSVQLGKGRGDQRGPAVVLPDQIHGLLHLLRAGNVRSAQDNRSRMLDLVNKKLSEILNVHFALGSINNRNGTV